MIISGIHIKLRSARLSDRRKIFLWLTKSDLTPSMMGFPNYPDTQIPVWKEFCQDYNISFFNSSGDKKGRNFIILSNNTEIGTVGYDLFNENKSRVLLDIWLRAEKYCGLGYGSDALVTLCNYLHQRYGIKIFYISPSSRNKRAISAYYKSGFKKILMSRNKAKKEFGVNIFDYSDNVVLKKKF
ncbi:GNAT family N-acetyltransferase [Candidatus Latescibacterota bacterium]